MQKKQSLDINTNMNQIQDLETTKNTLHETTIQMQSEKIQKTTSDKLSLKTDQKEIIDKIQQMTVNSSHQIHQINSNIASNSNTHHKCNHQHHQNNINHNSHHLNIHNHVCQHQTTCKHYNKQTIQQTQVTPIHYNQPYDSQLVQALAKYLKGDLHKVWTIVDKLAKAQLVDKKLQGVFILKQLGLNKGTGPLKSLTTNNGNIPKTLNDLMPKTAENQQIPYLKQLPKQKQYIIIIDGLPLALCHNHIKKYCLSHGAMRQIALIILFMLIEIAPGFFFVPKQYITQQLLQRIHYTVSNMKIKTKAPFKLKLTPVQSTVQNGIMEKLKQIKKQQQQSVILISSNTTFLSKCLSEYPEIKLMEGTVFIDQILKVQDKLYVNELLSKY